MSSMGRLARKGTAEVIKLHLGCGSNIMPGWINMDRDSKNKDIISWDAKDGIPYGKNTIDLIYSEHFIEHIPRFMFFSLLHSCYRSLKTGGVIRVSTPDLRTIVTDYLSVFYKDKYSQVGWSPQTGAEFFNGAMRMWDHQYIYDEEELMKIAKEIGFQRAWRMEYRKSMNDGLKNLECRPDYGDLIMEFMK